MLRAIRGPGQALLSLSQGHEGVGSQVAGTHIVWGVFQAFLHQGQPDPP
ncbi:MAG TPA: hypothetical protein VGJ89_10855 [Geothrix sp.]